MKLDPALQQQLLHLVSAERSVQSAQPSQQQRELQELQQQLGTARSVLGSAQLNVSNMEQDIRRIEEDIAKLKQREQADKAVLASATEREQRRDAEHDVATTVRRMDDLRGELKECHDELHALRAVAERHRARVGELGARIDALDVPEATDVEETVVQLRALFDAATLAAYDEQRAVSGVGAAPFVGRSCGGCFIVLPQLIINTIRNTPADEVPRCPDCGTYLVRG